MSMSIDHCNRQLATVRYALAPRAHPHLRVVVEAQTGKPALHIFLSTIRKFAEKEERNNNIENRKLTDVHSRSWLGSSESCEQNTFLVYFAEGYY